jgi:acetyl-CoA carboxylase biotin carboxyl carrier protein
MAVKKKTTRKSSAKKTPAKKTIKQKSVAAKKGGPKRASAVKSATDPRIDRLKTLIKLIEKSELGELSYEDSDIRVTLKQGMAQALAGTAQLVTTSAVTSASAAAPAGVEGVANENDDSLHVVSSPFVGTYYASPSPDASAYTGMGQTVAQGQTVCIVEAMKLMNEIESEVSGVVVEILVENGQGVQYGDPLFRIKVS